MAKVTSGPAPWSEGFKRVNKLGLLREGMEWSLASGYRKKQDWDKAPKKPKTKKVKLYNGRIVEVPDADFEDFIGHHATTPSDPYTAVGQYIDKAFEDLTKIQDVQGIGHIEYIEYSPRYQILRVEFNSDGAVVVFFRVPKEVYSELKYLAETKATAISSVDGEQRHVLGMRFWDIVRIRGQREGSRYRYEYTIEGEYTPTGGKISREVSQHLAEAKKQDEGSALKGKEEEEMIDLLNTFASKMLTGTLKEQYNKLKTYEDKYRFMRKHGLSWEE